MSYTDRMRQRSCRIVYVRLSYGGKHIAVFRCFLVQSKVRWKRRRRTLDKIHLELPCVGSRGMKNELRNEGHDVGKTHVRTLMRKLGIEALYKKPRLSKPHPGHKIYPFLLCGLDITEANAAWCSDITYKRFFLSRSYHMDWASKKVLSFRLYGSYLHGSALSH